jgi:hypothetical protein
VDNGGEDNVEVLDLQLLSWPAGNGRLTEVRLDDMLIWEGEYEEGEVLELLEGAELTIEPDSPIVLAFKFAWAPGLKGYELSIAFDVGCMIEGIW